MSFKNDSVSKNTAHLRSLPQFLHTIGTSVNAVFQRNPNKHKIENCWKTITLLSTYVLKERRLKQVSYKTTMILKYWKLLNKYRINSKFETDYKKCVTKIECLMKRPVSIFYIFQHYEQSFMVLAVWFLFLNFLFIILPMFIVVQVLPFLF